ncbi:hypothetical protein BD770DRAFT_13120 [Pilaira anomala]|nr:hypothetical protein BD770DRAFT_13120 [Pilaira anomala]
MSISDEASFSNELLTSTPLSLTLHVPGPTRFYVDHIDISERFYSMQQYVFHFVEAYNLILESDVHLILSTARIFPIPKVHIYPTLRANPYPKLRIYFADFPYLHCSIN